MKTAQDFMLEVPVLKFNDQITKARQILRDNRFREVYVVDAKKNLLGYIDLTDGLRVTATKSNVTVEGFVKEAPMVSPADPIEQAAKSMREYKTDSVAVVDTRPHILGGVLLSDIFPVIISRNELHGTVSAYHDKGCHRCKSDGYGPENLYHDYGERLFRISRGEEETDCRINFPARSDPDTAGAVGDSPPRSHDNRGSDVQGCRHYRSG